VRHNQIETCAIAKIANLNTQFWFIECIEANDKNYGSDYRGLSTYCAAQAAIGAEAEDAIDKCYFSAEGN